MSTAAMQPVSQTTSTLDSRTIPTSPVTGRQYQQSTQQSPSSRDTYHITPSSNPPTASTSPRRSSRRPSRAGPSGPSSTSPQPNARGPNGSSSTTSPSMPLHNQVSPPPAYDSAVGSHSQTSPVISYGGSNQLELRGGPPIPPPPRTSSNQQGQHAASQSAGHASARTATSGESRYAGDDRPLSSRVANAGDGRERRDRERASVERERGTDDTASAAAAAARSRRRARRSPRAEEAQQSATTGDTQARQAPEVVPAHSRRSTSGTNAAAATAETGISREGSTVINRVVVTDPAVDLECERERLAEARPSAAGTDVTPITGLGLVGSEGVDDGGRGGAGNSRRDQSSSHSRRKDTRFGDYILGQTLGEGEFGKVRMGWKQEGGVQVAIKLIRRESLGTNPSRLPKIYREIAILRELSHPNIVRLHEMVETDRHIGIILEYASGGELFDYILTHRYLKDASARRLFAQLVSGVGYLHKKGIVHRDLKLENLLLDRNKNIIITDFGFANTFDPKDEVGDEIEYNLTDKDFVRRMDLERVRDNGFRRGDLMQTSCGSPCYAAPELVVSDSLYTGRKVDVWSCGVILYAMLAGYLPFDDDPANPEGDNINLLYKYIVSTPLTFPEYVTPHARDLLRRILVAEPIKRADLFEVARHSWLSEYAHVVSFITSSTTTTGEIANTTVTADHQQETPLLARSASVREPSKSHQPHHGNGGGLSQKQGQIDQKSPSPSSKPHRDAKRRTVQLEYVAPQSETTRGPSQAQAATSYPATGATSSKTRARSGSQGPVEAPIITTAGAPSARSKATAQEVTEVAQARDSPAQTRTAHRPSSSSQNMGPPARPARDIPRSVSDSTGGFGTGTPIARPDTGGSLTSAGSRSGSTGLPSRASYSRPGQPAAPAVAATNAQGRLAQPKNGKQYVISSPIPQQGTEGRPPSYGRLPTGPSVAENDVASPASASASRSHKRSNTVGGIGEKFFGRSGALFAGRPQAQTQVQGNQEQTAQRPPKNYPPTSMSGPLATGERRPSTDSRRSTSFGFGRKSSGLQEKPRRFSFLPASFSLKNLGGGTSNKDIRPPGTAQSMTESQIYGPPAVQRSRPKRPEMAFGRGASQSTTGTTTTEDNLLGFDGPYRDRKTNTTQAVQRSDAGPPRAQARRVGDRGYVANRQTADGNSMVPGQGVGPSNSASATASESSLQTGQAGQASRRYPPGFNPDEREKGRAYDGPERGATVLQKPNRKFIDAYEPEPSERRYGQHGHNSGSSGAARKVMDFFRRRGRGRGWDG